MWAHTPLNLPWSSGHQVRLRIENRDGDGIDSQTLALVASILESAVIQTTTFRICEWNVTKGQDGSALVPVINSMWNFLHTR